MFEVGWTEMLVIAIVMIVVVGPKDLPNMLRTFGRMAAKARGMANDFRRQFDEALKEAELDDARKSVESLRSLNPATEIRKQLNPFEKAAQDVRAGLDQAMKPKPAAPPVVEASDAPAHPSEPLKNGAAGLPGAEPPQAQRATPVVAPASGAAIPAAVAVPAAAKAPKARATTAKAATTKAAASPAASGKPAGSSARRPAARPDVAEAASSRIAAPRKTAARTTAPEASAPRAAAPGKAGADASPPKPAGSRPARAAKTAGPEKTAPAATGRTARGGAARRKGTAP